MVYAESGDYLVEAETHLGDFQALGRSVAGKARDIGADGIVLLLADARHHRGLVRDLSALKERFAVDARTWFRAVATERDPGGDALVIL
ncbi:MAG TPA: hypothetical protein VMQ65_09980 [Candidatus Limnocylindria bacterium]|nr:hypothetical protein [Candidatus Limnocylindria bacterium]